MLTMSGITKLTVPLETLLPSALEFLEEGTPVILPVKGNSMLPFIIGGRDNVLISRQPSVREGDVVLAHTTAGSYVIHRIIGMGDGHITLKGDGNLKGTETCLPEGILGTVLEIQKPSGRKLNPVSVKGWQKLPLILRRVIIAVYRRLFGQ